MNQGEVSCFCGEMSVLKARENPEQAIAHADDRYGFCSATCLDIEQFCDIPQKQKSWNKAIA